jgi:Catalytic LigB subunit of aromatic ring-opening dioxygenase
MAEFLGAVATSHAPPIFLEPQYWTEHSDLTDRDNPELVSPRTGRVTPYADLVTEVAASDPGLLAQLSDVAFRANYERMAAATGRLRSLIRELAPDVVVVVSDDQEEIFFDDNMPMFSVYWGRSWTLLPWRSHRAAASPLFDAFKKGWGDRELDVPVDAAAAEHVIASLASDDFDIAHFRYFRAEYGGTVGPAGYLASARTRPPARRGVPHGFAYVVKTLMDNDPVPMVPVFINTCYPPNRPTARRCYDFGIALRKAIETMPGGRRVLLIASGGLSHFVLDEALDRLLIRGLQHDDRAVLENLPRLDSPTGEIRNWVAAAGACRGMRFELFDYVPTPRSAAGTGGGWCFARWNPPPGPGVAAC